MSSSLAKLLQMIKHPIRRFLGLTVLYSVIILGIFLLQFRSETAISQTFSGLRLHLVETQSDANQRILKNTFQSTYKGLSLLADEQNPVIITTLDGRQLPVSLLSWQESSPLNFTLFFQQDVAVRFSVNPDDSSDFLSVEAILPENVSDVSIPYKPASGYLVTEQDARRIVISSKTQQYEATAHQITDQRLVMSGREQLATYSTLDSPNSFEFSMAIALPLAAVGMAKGGVAWGAAGALLGSTIGEAAALLYMMWQHRRAAKGEGTLQKESEEMLHGKTIAQRLIAVSIPITLGACIVPLAGFIDSVMLTQLMEKAGMAAEDALIRYGAYSGPVLTLINVPTALAMAMSTNLVPSIASGLARGDMDYVKRETATGLRLATVIGFPCSIGMSLLAKPLLYLCYRGSYTGPQLDVAAELLTVSSLTIVLFTMVQATSGILQGAGKQRIPMYTLLIGVVLKIALNYTLVGIPGVDIHGAPWASLLCYTASMIPNLYFVCKHTGYRFHLMDVLVKPLGCSAVMGGVVFALWHFLFGDPGKLHGAWLLVGILLCVIAGVAVYAALAIFTKTIRKEDLPGKVRRFLK